MGVTMSVVSRAQSPADTTRRPQSLPAVTTIADRPERELFKARPNVGFVTITAKELAAAPRFFGESDILRAVRLLPGVNARNDFSVGMNVRGGEADQNLVMLDGFRRARSWTSSRSRWTTTTSTTSRPPRIRSRARLRRD
jgi:hypothetical protein